jgi:hypothetical protein
MTDQKELLQKLADCVAACEHCMDSCLGEQDIKMMVECIRTDRDCAKICSLTASFVASNSQFVGHILTICEDICNKCAQECEKHNMDHCQKCAQACHECAKACRVYADEMHYA